MAQNVQIKIETDEGTVVIHTPVFRRLIEEAVREFGDDVRIAKYKGAFPDLLQKVTGTDYLDALDYSEENGRLRLSVCLIVREDADFGSAAQRMIDSIREKIVARTGVVVESVDLIVTAHLTPNGIVDVKDETYRG